MDKKMVSDQNEISNTVMNGAFNNNIVVLIDFYLTTLDQLRENNKVEKSLRDFNERLLTHNVFLNMYSLMEEYLFHKCNTLDYQSDGKTGLARFKKYLPDEVTVGPVWQYMMDAEKFRNCLLHANGRILAVSEERRGKLLKAVVNDSQINLHRQTEKENDLNLVLQIEYLDTFKNNAIELIQALNNITTIK